MIKVIAACGSGTGSSLIMKMRVQEALKSLGIEADVRHSNVGEAKASAAQYHIIVCSDTFKDMFAGAAEKGVVVVGLKNILDKKEITEKLKPIDFAALEKKVHA